MARARNIKPSFFKNELLGEGDPLLGLLFISLWTLADKAGRLEDRPLRIKAETFPYRDNIDINGYLTQLLSLGFIDRYKAVCEGKEVAIIEIVNFTKHQTPHSTEKASELPSRPIDKPLTLINASPTVNGHINVLIPDSSNTDSSNTDSSNTDSSNTDSLIPDSPLLIPLVVAAEKSAPPKIIVDTEFQNACKQTWKFYSDAYWNRYHVEPVRNQKINTQIKNFVQRIGYEESPHVAAHYLQSNSSYYVGRGHAVDGLLSDAEKLRTEWVTGKTMTTTRASQIDKTESNKSAISEAMAILERA